MRIIKFSYLLSCVLLICFPSTSHAAEDIGNNMIPIYQLLLLNHNDSETVNNQPIADSGADQSTVVGNLVMISGSASSDPDGDSLSYSWSGNGPVGTNATLSSFTDKTISFTPDLAGIYVIQLIVNDGTSDSAPDTVTISATAAPAGDVYSVTVSRESSNIYDVEYQDIYIFTNSCFEFVNYDDSTLYGDDEIEFEDGSTCNVDGVYQKHNLANGAYSVTVTRKEQDWYSLLSVDSYINTQYCYQYKNYDNAILEIDFLGTGTLEFNDGSTCDVVGYYTRMSL